LAEPRAMLAPAESFALRGCILTLERKIEDGSLVVEEADISEVRESAPGSSMPVIDTEGVILPGLIDLHGHPEYNVFSAWEPPKQYINRYQWRRSDEYARVIREPWKILTEEPSLLRTLTRYAEARALVGGATAIQGASARYPSKEESLVRNVDLRIFGEHRARSIIDLDARDLERYQRIRTRIDAEEIKALYVHLAEGTDDRSRAELDKLIEIGLLTAATVIIHGTGLTDEQLEQVRDVGAKLVWSPQSNLRLYGHTTRAAHAMSLGIPIGLGADWLPSGSPSLLAELKVARRTLKLQGTEISSQQLVKTVTKDAARIASLEDFIGALEPGRKADILVLERRREDPWENVVEADPSWVELVTIGGNLVYGRPDWMEEYAVPGEAEHVLAWAKPMVLDTSYSVAPTASPPPRLAGLRAELIDRYPQVGPIFV
jgi:5-methylthioadenosine/S-adenosylhomocysteine deaminase